MHEQWLQMLLNEASTDELIAHRDRLAEAAPPGEVHDIERAARSALQLRSLLAQRRQRATELSALNDIATLLTTMHDHHALLQEIVDQAKRLLGVDLSYLALIHDDILIIEVTSGAYTAQLLGLTVPFREGLIGRVVENSSPAWTPDYRNDPSFAHIGPADDAARAENMRGLLAVPLQVDGKILGALCACKRQERRFGNEEVALLSALAAHASVAIENARLLEQYRATVAEINAANTELAKRTALLEQTLTWDRSLTHVVLRGGGVRELVQEASASTRCPVFFVTGRGEIPPGLQHLRSSVVRAFDILAADRREQALTLIDGEQFLFAVEVRSAGDRLGVLFLTSRQEPTAAMRLVLERSAPAVALALVGERAAREATRRARDAFLVDLITRPAPTPAEVTGQFRLAGLNPDRSYTVVVARPADAVDRARRSIEEIAFPPGTVVAEHGSRVIAMIPGMTPTEVAAAWVQPAENPTVGIADPAVGGEGLARAYVEAQRTVDVLETLGRASHVEAASSLGIYRILLSHTGRDELEMLTQRSLGPLLEEEARRGVPLLDTLASYLAHNCRHSATATALAIHANTLYQRLESIDRLIGTEWRQPDQALDLALLIRLRASAGKLGQI
ncbi:helix-turn-helix domain-containing protein [Rhodococcus sp. NPDC056743]|uniref:helix-turn-helix domain-containing protein n=1 Tax=Rhodococcus sp. NPDC056743 TaxID=3345934 RepID=UPI00366E3A0A